MLPNTKNPTILFTPYSFINYKYSVASTIVNSLKVSGKRFLYSFSATFILGYSEIDNTPLFLCFTTNRTM